VGWGWGVVMSCHVSWNMPEAKDSVYVGVRVFVRV